MEIINIADREIYNNFVLRQENCQFLQSWEWGDFQLSVGSKVIRLGLKVGNEVIYALTLIKKSLPLGLNYYYSPRIDLSPLDADKLSALLKGIADLAVSDKVIFFRFEPLAKFSNSDFQFPISKTIDIQPSKTLVLDLTDSEEELMSAMHPKTRYNIRLTERKGVTVREADSNEFDGFWRLMQETKNRDGFRLHGEAYYRKMLEIPFVKLFVAEYESSIIAGNILSFFGNSATYVHGASSSRNRNIMAPYALQWKTITEAKKHNLSHYDFNGIDEGKWPGVTRFKKGYGGVEINFPGTFDLIFNGFRYSAYKMIRKIRRSF